MIARDGKKRVGMNLPSLQNSFVSSENPSERILLSNTKLITVQEDVINNSSDIKQLQKMEQKTPDETKDRNLEVNNSPGGSNTELVDNTNIKSENDAEIAPFRKFYLGNKKRTVRRKEKKVRQNLILRKMLKPKTALMALNELASEKAMSHCKITLQGNSFIAEICVNDNLYEGCGPTKISAKNNASEKALRDLIILKMSRTPKQEFNIIPNKGSVEDLSMDVEEKEKEKDKDKEKNDSSEEEVVPMLHLASFALHKLFTEWESEGFHIPDFKMATHLGLDADGDQPMLKVSDKLLGPVRSELPPNPETLHPCMLLALMRPGITFTEISSEGLSPNVTHKVCVTVDNKEYIGEARSKRLARKLVASQACADIFKVIFPPDNYF